jgi:hypothetical protein
LKKGNHKISRGFLAHEFREVLPEYVVKINPNALTEEERDHECIQDQYLIPILVSAVQKLQKRVAELEEK